MHSNKNQICLFSSWLAGCTRIKLDLFRESLYECFASRLCNIASWSCASRNATYQMAFQHMHGRRHTICVHRDDSLRRGSYATPHFIFERWSLDLLLFFLYLKHMPSSLCETNEPPKRPNKQENAAKAKLCCLQSNNSHSFRFLAHICPYLSARWRSSRFFLALLEAATLMQPVDLVGSFTDFQLRTSLR